VLMTISQTEWQTYRGVPSGGSFEIKLYPVGKSKPFWSANLGSQTSGYGGIGIPSQGANSIVDRLVKDNLIKLRKESSTK
ncbi:MAG TPA: hypothetical protein VMU30_12415, partial [Bacteroidota bacterium]|nr:hypothetical protein [Bacteroidota bacterium]